MWVGRGKRQEPPAQPHTLMLATSTLPQGVHSPSYPALSSPVILLLTGVIAVILGARRQQRPAPARKPPGAESVFVELVEVPAEVIPEPAMSRSETELDVEQDLERIFPMIPRRLITKRMAEVLKEHDELRGLIDKLADLDRRLTCPLCRSNRQVQFDGRGQRKSGHSGSMIIYRRFRCRAVHTPEEVISEDRSHYFRTRTSLESIQYVQQLFHMVVRQLLITGGTQKGLAKLWGVSRKFVEFGADLITTNMHRFQPRIKLKEGKPYVIIFFDTAGSKVSRNYGLVTGNINGKPIYLPIHGNSRLTSYAFLSTISKLIPELPKGTQMLFVSDGEPSFVEDVQQFFPGAIHIRQFHAKQDRGIVFVHFHFNGKEHTAQVPWDLVLDDGKAKKATQRKRTERARKRREEQKKKAARGKEESEPHVIEQRVRIWVGRKHDPPRPPQELKPTENNQRRADEKKERAEKSQQQYTHPLHSEKQRKPSKPRRPAARLLFEGSVEEAASMEQFRHVRAILSEVFAGRHITSNLAEVPVASLRLKLKPMRTIRSGTRGLKLSIVQAYAAHLSDDDLDDVLWSIFCEDAITGHVVSRRRITGLEGERLLQELQHQMGVPVRQRPGMMIHYKRAGGKRSTRRVIPLELEQNSYTKLWYLKAWCCLREETRTFRLDRVTQWTPLDEVANLLPASFVGPVT